VARRGCKKQPDTSCRRRFVALCRTLDLSTEAIVAIDGSKFKAMNNPDKNFTRAKMKRRMGQIEESGR
jgi:hypothetical protein